MDYLRQSVNLRGYAQKNPIQEFKRESFAMFESLLENINVETVKSLSSVSIDENTSAEEVEQQDNAQATAEHDSPAQEANDTGEEAQTYQRSEKKVGRNDPCPCGSGKKYKNCHG